MEKLLSATVLLSVLSSVLGYAAGPPISTCTDMIPAGHNSGVSRATGAAPYTITTSALEYTPGGTLEVTITGTAADKFKGFFIQARRTDAAKGTVDEAIGVFSVPPAETQLVTCHTIAGSGWAHSTNTERTMVMATWTAPAQDEGPIMFMATIIKGVPDRSYFYTNVMSAPVNLMGAATGGATEPPAVGTTSGGTDQGTDQPAAGTTSGGTDQPAAGTTSGAPMHSVSAVLACLATLLAGVFIMRRN